MVPYRSCLGLVLALPLSLVGVVGCSGGGGETDTDSATDSDTGAELPAGCDAYVQPSDNDQDTLQGALLDAAEGDTVCLAEGTFKFNTEVSVSTNGITLKGMGQDKTLLDFTAQDLGGNGIRITGDNVTVTSLGLRDTPGDGIRADDVSNITFEDVVVGWTAQMSLSSGAYGLYPVGCTGVTVRRSRVYGARDAGIYVGQSSNILVEDSEADGNVAGIEIENSTDAVVRNNHAHDNTAGLLIFNLPGLDVKDGKRTLAYGNLIENNNIDNFGLEGTAVAKVPRGLGMMIMASDHNELRDNTVRNNTSTAVVIVAYNTDLFDPYDDAAYNKYAEGNYVHDNTFEGNGLDPDDLVVLLAKTAGVPVDGSMPIPDIIDDGCYDAALDNSDGSLTNCISNNNGGSATYASINLCGQGEVSMDPAFATCTHPTLPDVP